MFSSKASSEKSFALSIQDFFIFMLCPISSSLTADLMSSIFASLSINIPVIQSSIISLTHQSFTQITGTQHAIDSTGVIQKSSSTGIKTVAIDSHMSFLNVSSSGASIVEMFLYHLTILRMRAFSGSFFQYDMIRFFSGISIKALAILSTLFISVSLAQLK